MAIKLLAAGALFLVLAVLVTPLATPFAAHASNDPRVVGDDCSGNDNAVGQPTNTGNSGETVVNAVDFGESIAGAPDKVDGPASLNNPGESTGAKSQSIVGSDCDPRTD